MRPCDKREIKVILLATAHILISHEATREGMVVVVVAGSPSASALNNF